MSIAGKVNFENVDNSEFYSTLKSRVDDYFKKKGITSYANGFMLFKILFFFTGLVGSYLLLILSSPSLGISYLLWASLGLFTAFAGVNIGHDAIHGAISSNKTINKALGFVFDIAGANGYLWKITHNQIHHTYTNIPEFDEDVNISPMIRLSTHQKRRKMHRYQHLYTLFLYCLTSLSWVFLKDYKRFFSSHIGNHAIKSPPWYEYFNLFLFKSIYYVTFLIVPFLLIDFAWWHILLGFILMHALEGFALAIIIQLAHMVKGVEFPVPDDSGTIKSSWAIHQLKTTVDFARNNPLVSFFFGGLNFHIEHHLFQRVCHVHHKPISNIVEKTALEFSLPYHEIPTLGKALQSHIGYLKNIGRSV